MNATALLRYPKIPLVLTALVAALLIVAQPAWADRHHRRVPMVRSGHHHGHVMPRLPAGFISIRLGAGPHYYHGGRFYRPHHRGFVTVAPPIGCIVLGLPIGYRTVVSAGMTFYLADGVYYRRVPDGYVVVPRPVESSSTVITGAKVAVTTDLLNLRASPGMDQPVVRQINRNEVLTVRGEAPGWLYVELADGALGWVVAQYTTALTVPANG